MHPFAPRNRGTFFQQPPDAAMHPFAPRNRPQFPGAMQGGIMGGMGGGPQMTQGFQGTGQLAPPSQQWMKPWEMRQMQNARYL
jgi:hypothetical protein